MKGSMDNRSTEILDDGYNQLNCSPHAGINTPLTPPAGRRPVTINEGNQSRGWFCRVWKVFQFHLANAFLGISAFIVIITFLSTSVGLIPCFGIGLLFLRFTLDLVRFFALLDIQIHNNMVVRASDKIVNHIRLTEGIMNISKDRPLFGLLSVSCGSAVAILYFCTVKFTLGVASLSILSYVFGLPVTLAVMVLRDEGNDWQVFGFTYDSHPTLYWLTCIASIVVALLLAYPMTVLTQLATRGFLGGCKSQLHEGNNHTAQPLTNENLSSDSTPNFHRIA